MKNLTLNHIEYIPPVCSQTRCLVVSGLAQGMQITLVFWHWAENLEFYHIWTTFRWSTSMSNILFSGKVYFSAKT